MSNKRHNNWAKFGIPVIVALRLILPPLLWRNALVTLLLMMFADWVDGDVFRRAFSSMRNNIYQLIDKSLDLYGYCFALAFAVSSPLFTVFLLLFLWRLVGLLVFLFQRDRKIFVFFPNVFELFFLLYALTLTFPSLKMLLEGNYFWFTLLWLTVFKIIWEYLLHVSHFFTSVYEQFVDAKWLED